MYYRQCLVTILYQIFLHIVVFSLEIRDSDFMLCCDYEKDEQERK